MTGRLGNLQANETESNYQELIEKSSSHEIYQSKPCHDGIDGQQPKKQGPMRYKRLYLDSSPMALSNEVEQHNRKEPSTSKKIDFSNVPRDNNTTRYTGSIPANEKKEISNLTLGDQSGTEGRLSSSRSSTSRSTVTRDSSGYVLPHLQKKSLITQLNDSALHSSMTNGTVAPFNYSTSHLPPLAFPAASLSSASYYSSSRSLMPLPISTQQYTYPDQVQYIPSQYANGTIYHQPTLAPQYWTPMSQFSPLNNRNVHESGQLILSQGVPAPPAATLKAGSIYHPRPLSSTETSTPPAYTRASISSQSITDSNSSTKNTNGSEDDSSLEPNESSNSKHCRTGDSAASLKGAPANKVMKVVAKRSRNGCLTCRSRKRKCDENKPICNECRRLRIKCIWMPRTQRRNKSKKHPYTLRVDETYNTEFGVIKVVRGKVDYKIEDGQIVQNDTSSS